MQAMQSWCYTVFAGVLFSGIIMMLTPSERFRPLIQMILGLFLLVCLISWGRSAGLQWDIDTREAETRRQETAQRTEDYFMDRVAALSQEEITAQTGEYLAQYGIKQGEFKIYMETKENPDESVDIYLLLRLPQRAAEYSTVISRALGYQFGMDVRIETDGTAAD